MRKYQTEEERKEASRERCRRYYQEHKNEILERTKQYQYEHREDISEKRKRWRKTDPDEAKKIDKKNYATKKDKNPNYQKEEYQNNPIRRANALIGSYRYKDKIHNRGECTLTSKWIVENIFTQPCAHCGETDWRKIGCNRLDNSKPHTQDNVEPCCFKCNMKVSGGRPRL